MFRGFLAQRRLRDYFSRLLEVDLDEGRDYEQWERLLCNLELATVSAGQTSATIDGMLLFGLNFRRFLPQSVIRAIFYTRPEPDFVTRVDEDIKGPLVPLGTSMAQYSKWELLIAFGTSYESRNSNAKLHYSWVVDLAITI